MTHATAYLQLWKLSEHKKKSDRVFNVKIANFLRWILIETYNRNILST